MLEDSEEEEEETLEDDADSESDEEEVDDEVSEEASEEEEEELIPEVVEETPPQATRVMEEANRINNDWIFFIAVSPPFNCQSNPTYRRRSKSR